MNVEAFPKDKYEDLQISFDFRTYQSKGLLIYHPLKWGHLKIFMQDSRLKTILTNSKEVIQLDSFDLAYDDGHWHTCQVKLSVLKLNFTIDSETLIRYIKSPSKSSNRFLIGDSGQLQKESSQMPGFIGNIKNLKLWSNTKYTDLKIVDNEKVVTGLAYMDDKCWPNPCQNGGVCKQNASDFHCECEGTGYMGSMCHTSLFYRSCMDFSALNPSTKY